MVAKDLYMEILNVSRDDQENLRAILLDISEDRWLAEKAPEVAGRVRALAEAMELLLERAASLGEELPESEREAMLRDLNDRGKEVRQ